MWAFITTACSFYFLIYLNTTGAVLKVRIWLFEFIFWPPVVLLLRRSGPTPTVVWLIICLSQQPAETNQPGPHSMIPSKTNLNGRHKIIPFTPHYIAPPSSLGPFHLPIFPKIHHHPFSPTVPIIRHSVPKATTTPHLLNQPITMCLVDFDDIRPYLIWRKCCRCGKAGGIFIQGFQYSKPQCHNCQAHLCESAQCEFRRIR
jgi:hypothetical protein